MNQYNPYPQNDQSSNEQSEDEVLRMIEQWRQNNDPRYAKLKNTLMRSRLDNEDVLADYNRKFEKYA